MLLAWCRLTDSEAAATPKPRNIGTPAITFGDRQACDMHHVQHPSERSAHHPHAMKLLDPDNVRSLLMLRRLDADHSGLPSWHDNGTLPHVPETNSDFHHDGTTAVVDQSDVNKLLALDIEELMQHTFRVQRRRHIASYPFDTRGVGDTAFGSSLKTTQESTRKAGGRRLRTTVRGKPRRKRRRTSRSVSPSPSDIGPTPSRLSSTIRNNRQPGNKPIRALPLHMGLSPSETKHMRAALNLASHDARLLRTNLKYALGSAEGLLPERAARAAVDSLVARGDTHGDLDTETALRLCRAVAPSPDSPEGRAKSTGTRQEMNPESGCITVDARCSSPDKNRFGASPSSGGAASPQGGVCLDVEETNHVLPDDDENIYLKQPTRKHPNSGDGEKRVVDRQRLIVVLAAEERINAMASHLGSLHAMTNLSSLLVPAKGQLDGSLAPGLSGEPENRSWTTATKQREAHTTGGIPDPSHDFSVPREDGRSWLGTQGRAHSAEDTLSHPKEDGNWRNPVAAASFRKRAGGGGRGGGDTSDAEGDNHCRKKRSKRGEKGSIGAEKEQQGVAYRAGDNERSRLQKSSSFAEGQRHQAETIEAGVVDTPSRCSLPKLKASSVRRVSTRDEYDRFGGRETPSVLRRSALSGGGEKSWKAVEQLRHQLEITECGLLDLNARVRADVAWVQETVGARMSRRARVSCCKWGSEKIAELTFRWERRSLHKAIGTWTRYREYVANKDLVRAYMKRRGAAQARRLLNVWGCRLTSKALGEWRRRVRLERRAEEAAAASTLQRVVLGFLGRRRFRCVLATRCAICIQKAARGRTGRLRAGRVREGIRRNSAATKIQDQVRKRGERRRAKRIAALKTRRRGTIKIQKCARGFIGRRKVLVVREKLLHQHGSIIIQTTWRGLLGRRKARETRRDMELTRAAQNKAAIHIQTAQRRKAAMAAAETRRKIQALQRRKSAEIAAISIQRVVRGQAARAATGAKVAKRKERQRAAAAVHIQRIARGRAARERAACVGISHDIVIPPPPLASPQSRSNQGDEDQDGLASSAVAGPEPGAGNDGVGAPISASTLSQEQVQTSALPQEDESKAQDATAAQQHEEESSSTSATADLQQPPAVAALSHGEKEARAQAACRIQAIRRGRAARTVAQERRQKRIEEQFHRASVWGQRVDGGQDTRANQRASEKRPTPKSSSPQAPRRSSSLFSSGTGSGSRDTTESLGKQKGRPQAATRIQAAFRGGKARWEADRLRHDFKTRKIEADARAREKLEADAAVRIQTQARARAARARREEHRQRHAARVGSIRSSGKAAADDLRALSRPGTASAAVAATTIGQSPTVVGAGDAKGDVASILEQTAQALLPITMGSMSPKAISPTGSGGSFSLPPPVELAAIRTPSSVGSPISISAAASAAAALTATAGTAVHGKNPKSRKRSNIASSGSPSGGAGTSRAKPGSTRASAAGAVGRSRSPSSASPKNSPSTRSAPNTARRSVASPPRSSRTAGVTPSRVRRSVASRGDRTTIMDHRREGDDGCGIGGHDVGEGMEMSVADLERLHTEMRKGLEEELNRELRDTIEKELAAKLAKQEKERDRISREAEEERKRDREAVEEAMRAVQEAHNKDSEDIALIKVRLKEEEDARRAEQDAARQGYENCLAEIRAEAEKSRLAAEAVEALRREVAEKEEEKRKLREEADAQTQDQEAKEKRSKEQQSRGRGADSVEADPLQCGNSSAQEQGHQLEEKDEGVEKEEEEAERRKQRELEEEQRVRDERQKDVLQQLTAEKVEKQRVALAQLQAQLEEEEAKRLESHAAWEARQAEEQEIAREERRLELEAIEKLKRQLEEDKIKASQEQEQQNAEVRLQMESLRVLQEQAQEQERARQEAERVATAEKKAKEDAIVREGAKLMEDGDLESDEEGHARGSSTEATTTRGSSRSKSSGTAGSSSRQTSAESGGGMVSTDVEEVVKRDIESATGSRLAQVEGALRELSRKQAELESREKQLDEASGTSSAGALALVANAATTGGALSAVASGAETRGLVVSQGGGTAGSEWVEYWDESAGASYFFNTVTQEASWTNPNEGADTQAAGGAIVASEAGGGGAGGEGGRAAGPETLSQPEDGRVKWTECLDEASGSTYYYNVITGEAVWEKPAELSNMKCAVGGVPQFDRPEDWVCYLDETSGEEYWFNLTTGETQWGSV